MKGCGKVIKGLSRWNVCERVYYSLKDGHVAELPFRDPSTIFLLHSREDLTGHPSTAFLVRLARRPGGVLAPKPSRGNGSLPPYVHFICP